MIHINPPDPSFTILSSVCCNLTCASSGIHANLFCNPSFTRSCRLFPKMFESQIFFGSFSNSERRYLTNSSDCFSLPTIGETSVSTSVLIKCMTGSKQTHIFKRKSGKLVTGRVHGTTEIKYDIDFGIDDMEF